MHILRFRKFISIQSAWNFVALVVALALLNLPAHAGTLTSNISSTPPSNLSLNIEGSADWAHWGLNNASSFNHKAGVTQQISDITVIGSQPARRFTDARTLYDWTNGTPTSSNPGNTTGLFFLGVGNGFSLTVPADTNARTLKLYLGGWNATGRLQISLSDGSATPVDTTFGQANQVFDRIVTLDFSANSGGQTLLVQYTVDNDFTGGNISLQAATLQGGAGNQAPTINPIGNQSVTVGNPLSFSVTSNDPDGPPLLVTSIISSTPTLPAGAIFTDNGSGGTFNWTPNTGEDDVYTVTFRARENNGTGLFVDQPITITVNPSGGGNGTLTSNISSTPPSNLSLNIEGSADWAHWGLNNASSFNHKAGVTQQISDITVIGSQPARRFTDARTLYDWTNGTPTSSNPGNTTGLFFLGVGNGFSLTVPADTNARTLKLYLGGWNATGRLQISLSDGSATPVDTTFGQANQVFDRIVTLDFSANSGGQTLLVQYTVDNDFTGGNISLQAATLQGGAGNQAPTINPIGNQSVTVGNPLSFSVTSNDPDGPPLLVTSIISSTPTLPAGAIFTDNGSGGTFNWTPNTGEDDVYTVTFRARENNGTGLFVDQPITITVNPSGGGNQAPTINPIGNQSVTVGNPLSFSVTSNDPDGPPLLVTSIISSTPTLPAGAIFTDNGSGGTFNWTPNTGEDDVYTVTFRARENNGTGLFVDQPITITVNPSGGGNGTLTSNISSTPPSNLSLNIEGSADWAHWGLNNASSFNHKAGVTQQISDITVIGSQPARRFTDARTLYDWTNGTPTSSNPGNTTGLFFLGVGNGFSLTVPADTNARTLKLYLGGWNATGRLQISLSDGSATPVDTTFGQANQVFDRIVTLDFSANSGGQTLLVQYTVDNDFTGGNISLQAATLVGDPPTGGLPFSDDFNDGNANGWTTVDDVPAGPNPNWGVISGAYRQQSSVESTLSFTESYHTGTYTFLSAEPGPSLTDYRFHVDATFVGAGRGVDLGIMFRYVDNGNYYRLSVESVHGFTRLEKRVGGTFTPLASNTRGFLRNQTITFTIEVNGSTILIFQDNDGPGPLEPDALFAVTDADLASGTVALYTQGDATFDNVLIEQVSTVPAVVLSTPIAHSVVTGNTLDAAAIATNVPAMGRVEFLLDGGSSMVDMSAPFSAQFTSVSQGDHTVTAILRNSANAELDRDTNVLIGAVSNKIIAVGDSNTQGSSDNYETDNLTVDPRTISFQAYSALLAQELNTSLTPQPNHVINEGIGGDTTAQDLNLRLASILERNVGANQALVLLGTNDVLQNTPNGSGCTFGVNCGGTYKGNMQAIINNIITDIGTGITTPIVALLPPIFGSTANSVPFSNPLDPLVTMLNVRVENYNNVINNELTGHQVGADFFTYFLEDTNADNIAEVNRFSLFGDNLHPNGLGHLVVAFLWHNTINSANPVALPFILDDLTPSTAAPYLKQNLLEVGDEYYVDQAYTLASIPVQLADGRWIMTAAGDSGSTEPTNYLSFQVDRAVTVYVAYDDDAVPANRPAWLAGLGFVDSGLDIAVTGDPLADNFDVFSRAYNMGDTVALGGNSAAPAAGHSQYFVIVVAN